MNDKVTVTEIEGVNPNLLKMITLENENVRKWAIINKFKKLTPLFENVPFILPCEDDRLLLIGQTNGCKKIYSVKDTENKYEVFFAVANTVGNVVYLNDIDKNVAILTTDRGEYLFDKDTLKQKSDVFSSIAFLDNRLIFTKVMNHDGRDSHYYGDVNKEGKIGPNIYD